MKGKLPLPSRSQHLPKTRVDLTPTHLLFGYNTLQPSKIIWDSSPKSNRKLARFVL